MDERKEAFMRIVIGIVSGIIFALWKLLVIALGIFHWLYAVFAKKRSKRLAEFCNGWVNYAYAYYRYMVFATNQRPFPFEDLKKEFEKVDMGQSKAK